MVEANNALLLPDRAAVEAYLTEKQIPFKTTEHEAIKTMQDTFDKIKLEGDLAEGKIAKNVFFVNKKNKEEMFLLVQVHDTEVDQKALTKKLGLGSGNLRAGDADRLKETLGCYQGCVNLYSIANDKDGKVKLLIDTRVLDELSLIGFHPQTADATTFITQENLRKFLDVCGHDKEVIDFKKLAETASAAPEQKPQKGNKKKEEVGKKADAHKAGIEFKKHENLAKWYQQVITKAELIEYYDVSGCYILRPNSFMIWESIQNFLDAKFKSLEVKNCYFPIFVTKKALMKEESHLDGFAAEVAWVTKSGQSDLAEPIAIRPTSETIMYPAFAKWIQTHRDLPLLLNQWSNVVRWEFKHPTPFIRTREFLWQEGHTAHATSDDSLEFVKKILRFYEACYRDLLAVPSVPGVKSRDETFAGADESHSVELFVDANGRGIQGATSHKLGQNFSKMFGIVYQDEENKERHAWQTSWGFSTRSIGSTIMVHADDEGLVLPPRVAQIQVVLVPIVKKDTTQELLDKLREIAGELKAAGVRVHVDDRDNYNPGHKFNHWELRGVPLRLELGPNDLKSQEVKLVKRYNKEKIQASMENIEERVKLMLDEIHDGMYRSALEKRDARTSRCSTWEQFMVELNKKNIILAPWCNEQQCEVQVKKRSAIDSQAYIESTGDSGEDVLTGAAKTLNIPYEQPEIPEGTKCFACDNAAKVTGLWGRSY